MKPKEIRRPYRSATDIEKKYAGHDLLRFDFIRNSRYVRASTVTITPTCHEGLLMSHSLKQELLQVQKIAATKIFSNFVQYMWSTVDSAPLIWNWHLDIICNEFEAVHSGESRGIILNIPPGTGKSLFTNVLFPAYNWLQKPWEEHIFIAGVEKLAERDTVKLRDLLQSARYLELVQIGSELYDYKVWSELKMDQNEKNFFRNPLMGSVRAIGREGQVTGFRADHLNIDDPLDVRKVTPANLEEVNKDFITRFASRTKNEKSTFCITMQRLGENDLSDFVHKLYDLRRVALPMVFDPAIPWTHPNDPRKPGEVLSPKLYSQEYIERFKHNLVSTGHADVWLAHYQQTPVSASKQRVINFAAFGEEGLTRQQDVSWRILSIDASFKGTEKSDYCVITDMVQRIDGKIVIEHILRVQATFSQLLALVTKRARELPKVDEIVIEDKANGSALCNMLTTTVFRGPPVFGRWPIVTPVNPDLSKLARAQVAAVHIDSGGVAFSNKNTDWAHTFHLEADNFPSHRHDDQVDSVTQGITHLKGRFSSVYTGTRVKTSASGSPRRLTDMQKIRRALRKFP